MALRFRKSVKLFPGVRLNFSTSGISTTIGVRGASVNLGKRGAHLNLGIPGSGLSWRSPLSPAQTPPSARDRRSPLNPPPALPDASPELPVQQTDGEIRSADVSSLTSAGLEEFKHLVNEATLRRKTLSQSVAALEGELAVAERRLRNAQRFFLRLFYSKAKTLRLADDVQGKRERLQDAKAELAACAINVDFAFDQGTVNSFAALVRAFEELSRCAFIWDITGSVDTNRAKERTLATQSVLRIPVALKLTRSEIIESRFPALLFPNANGDDLYIYPGFVMTKCKSSDFALVDVRELDVSLRRSRFVEEETVPPDSPVVAQTWKKTNKDGSPDRRFADNFTIPLVEYGQLWLSSPTGLNEAFMFSNFTKAEAFAHGFERYRAQIQELASHAGNIKLVPSQDEDAPDQGDLSGIEEEGQRLLEVRRRWLIADAVVAAVVGFIAVYAGRAALESSGKKPPPAGLQTTPMPAETSAASVKRPVSPVPAPQIKARAAVPESDLKKPLNLVPSAVTKRELTFVQRSNVNLRSAPAATASVRATAPKGKRFSVFGTSGEWVEVGESSPEGWIHSSLLGPNPP